MHNFMTCGLLLVLIVIPISSIRVVLADKELVSALLVYVTNILNMTWKCQKNGQNDYQSL